MTMRSRDLRSLRQDKQHQRESLAEHRRDDEPQSDEPIHADPWADWTSESPRVVVGPLDI